LRVKGKLVRKSLKTKAISVAKLKLVDLDRHELKIAELRQPSVSGKIRFMDALAIYFAKGFRPVSARNKKDAKALKPASIAYYENRCAVGIVARAA
jgi:hypothetical protein